MQLRLKDGKPNRVIFRQPYMETQWQCKSAKSQAASERFCEEYLDGRNRFLLALRYPLIYSRYSHNENEFMRTASNAVIAVPETRETMRGEIPNAGMVEELRQEGFNKANMDFANQIAHDDWLRGAVTIPLIAYCLWSIDVSAQAVGAVSVLLAGLVVKGSLRKRYEQLTYFAETGKIDYESIYKIFSRQLSIKLLVSLYTVDDRFTYEKGETPEMVC